MDSSRSTISRLVEKLQLLEDSLNQANQDHYQAFEFVVACVQDMRDIVQKYGFEKKSHQIEFFRNVKPRVIGLLTYHRFILEYRSKERIADSVQMNQFAESVMREIRKTDEINEDIIHYLNSKSTHLDKIYFVQVRNLGTYNMMNHKALLDPDFSSLCDSVISNRIARKLIQSFLDQQSEVETNSSQKLIWTDSKAALVELIYALHYSRAVNEGNASLKEICRTFEKAFNIEVGNLYATFQDIQMRKGERAKYLISLVETFDRRLTEDENKE